MALSFAVLLLLQQHETQSDARVDVICVDRQGLVVARRGSVPCLVPNMFVALLHEFGGTGVRS